MTVISFVSAKGSPGVTTTVMGLASVWGRSAVVDLDPVGGDIALRHRSADGGVIPEQPGLVTLGAAVRVGDEAILRDHLQTSLAGPDVLIGATGPRQAQGLGRAWPHLARTLRTHDHDVFVDGGRFAVGSPVAAVLEDSDAIVFVVRSEISAVAHLRDRLVTLREGWSTSRAASIPLGVLVVGNPRDHRAAEDIVTLLATEGVRATNLGVVAEDPKGVAVFGRGESRSYSRSVFRRSLIDLVPHVRELARIHTDLVEGA